jgi:hypothetical protein
LIQPVPTDSQVVADHADIRIPFRGIASVEKSAQALGRKSYNVIEGLQAFKAELNHAGTISLH